MRTLVTLGNNGSAEHSTGQKYAKKAAKIIHSFHKRRSEFASKKREEEFAVHKYLDGYKVAGVKM